MNRNLSHDHALMVWETLQTWLDQDTAGQALLDRFQTDPSGAVGDLAEWLRSHSTGVPPRLATYISGGQVEKLINIAQAEVVLIQQTPSPTPPQDVWNVPYRQNPFFTGREDILNQLHEHFTRAKTAALIQPPAITGLGGIGKTQIAVEYAHRHREEYRYVLWVNASEPVTLTEGFVQIARVLQLPIKEEQNQNIVIEAVKQWLINHDGWLLILDNVDDLPLASKFLPTTGKGHVLLTTREHKTGRIARGFEVKQMERGEGVLFLLRRSKVLDSPDAPLTQAKETDQQVAADIVEEMDSLPLALDQAGAYIEEMECDLSTYLERYRQNQHQFELLKRRGRLETDYPNAVATTWSLNFKQVEQKSPIAADLLRFFAFLAPNAIPEELIVDGANELGQQLQLIAADALLLDEAIDTLRRFSLIQRNIGQHLLFIHRLVQTVLKANMTNETQHEWAERTVRAVNLAFPDVTNVTLWEQCERYLPHALVCATLIEEYSFTFDEAAHLLDQAAHYLYKRAQYPQAELLYQRALAIREQLRPLDPAVAASLYNLAELYRRQGNYVEAEQLYQRALTIREQFLGPEHLELAATLTGLAIVDYEQGNYAEAERLYQRALTIREQFLGPEHLDLTTSLTGLADLYRRQSKYEQAKSLYQRALDIREKVLGPEHLDLAYPLNGLATVDYEQGNDAEAERLYQRALAIWEKFLGSEHPDLTTSLTGLADLYRRQGKYEQAERLYQRARGIREQAFGSEAPEVAYPLSNLADLYQEQDKQDKYTEAERLYQRARGIREQLGPENPELAGSLNGLADLYRKQGKYVQAEPLYQRALHIWERLGPEHPDVAFALTGLASLYLEQDKYAEAELLYRRALDIREQALGPEHRYMAETLNGLADLYRKQGKYKQAEQLYQRALHIREVALGTEHPFTRKTANSYVSLLRIMGRDAEANDLEARYPSSS